VTADGSGVATVDVSAAVNTTSGTTYTFYPMVYTAPSIGTSGSACGRALGSIAANGVSNPTITIPVYIPVNGPSTSVQVKMWGTMLGQNLVAGNLNTVTLKYGDGPLLATATATGPSQAVTTSAAALGLSLSWTVANSGWYWVTVSNTGGMVFLLQAVAVYTTPDTTVGYYPYSAANYLWQYGLRVVRDYADPPTAYDCEVLEDDVAAPFALGGRVNLRYPAAAISATPRIVGVSRRLQRLQSGIVATPTIQLDNRAQSLVNSLVKKGSV
jgi:hypothetical protein